MPVGQRALQRGADCARARENDEDRENDPGIVSCVAGLGKARDGEALKSSH
jgi:hypothetical protein